MCDVERAPPPAAFDVDLRIDAAAFVLRSCHSEARRRRARNLLFAASATIHVETAASAVSGAKRRQVANKRAEQTSARKPPNSSPGGAAGPHARMARTLLSASFQVHEGPTLRATVHGSLCDQPRPCRDSRLGCPRSEATPRLLRRGSNSSRSLRSSRKPRPSGHSTS